MTQKHNQPGAPPSQTPFPLLTQPQSPGPIHISRQHKSLCHSLRAPCMASVTSPSFPPHLAAPPSRTPPWTPPARGTGQTNEHVVALALQPCLVWIKSGQRVRILRKVSFTAKSPVDKSLHGRPHGRVNHTPLPSSCLETVIERVAINRACQPLVSKSLLIYKVP
jgi:hypothetical protein